MCPHSPACPAPSAPDREAAHTVVSHPEQGWSLLCNGVVIFEDTGELLPDGAAIAPHRPTDLSAFDHPIGTHFDRPAVRASRHDGQAPAALPPRRPPARSWPDAQSGDPAIS
jgi:Family of unknown function (DUF5999)